MVSPMDGWMDHLSMYFLTLIQFRVTGVGLEPLVFIVNSPSETSERQRA